MSWDDKIDELRAPRLTDEDPAPHKRWRRRDTKHWCRGKVGVEHTPDIRLDRYAESLRRYPLKAGRRSFGCGWLSCGWVHWHWRKSQPWRYHCSHQRWCTRCGKILTHRLEPAECPDYSPDHPDTVDAKAG